MKDEKLRSAGLMLFSMTLLMSGSMSLICTRGTASHVNDIQPSSFLLPPSVLFLHPSVPLPSDVKANHWAARYVQEVLANGVMELPDGKEFHGEAKVTHGQTVLLLAKLAQELEAGAWQKAPSVPVPDSVLKPLEHGDWRTQKVTRYEMAKTLASMGDYVTNGLPRPAPNAKDLNQSEAFPAKPTITVSKTHPAYAALTYLVNANMVSPKSPILKADNKPILGDELSLALKEMVTGLTNRLTELGHDEAGNTPDAPSHKKDKKDKK